ncbi:MAG: hypothetical protein JNL74_05725 [Fibrobacteres bacterium]|nr:hypothetical protein [Fibrobacterota bacterium]
MRILLLILLLLLNCEKSSNPGAAVDPAELLPYDNDISSYTKKGSTSILSDAASIYNAIDGAAEKYIDLGFIEGVFQKYSNSSTDLDVSIFNHGSNENALRVLDEFYPSSPEILLSTEEGGMMVLDHGLIGRYSLHYVKAGIYTRIDTNEKTDIILSTAKQFCYNIGNKILLE